VDTGRSPVQRSTSEPAATYDKVSRAPTSPQADGRGGLRRRSSLLSNDIAVARAAAVQQHGRGSGRVECGGGSGGSPTIPEQQVCRRHLLTFCVTQRKSKCVL